MKSFLSSTYVDLIEHRMAAKDSLERLGSQTDGMEVFGARPEEPLKACLNEVENCDIFIGIYAHRYGYIPEGSQASITEQELHHANKHHKPIFCFILEDNFPWPPNFVEEEPGKSKLKEFKKFLSQTIVWEKFNTPDNLAYKVASSVGRHIGIKALSTQKGNDKPLSISFSYKRKVNTIKCRMCNKITKHFRVSWRELFKYEAENGLSDIDNYGKFAEGIMIYGIAGLCDAIELPGLFGHSPWKCSKCGDITQRNISGDIV